MLTGMLPALVIQLSDFLPIFGKFFSANPGIAT